MGSLSSLWGRMSPWIVGDRMNTTRTFIALSGVVGTLGYGVWSYEMRMNRLETRMETMMETMMERMDQKIEIKFAKQVSYKLKEYILTRFILEEVD